MSRLAREISPTGLYHIVFRGVNKQHIFEEETDYLKMIYILRDLKAELYFEIYSYCFMSNHVHLLIKEKNTGEISQIMKRLLTKYAMYFNKKYQRTGALIANRYKSQPVEFDAYFLSVIRYIHQNPVKAGIADKIEDYRWNSYNEYVDGKKNIVDTDFVLQLISRKEFKQFHQVSEIDVFLVSDKLKLTDEAIRRAIMKEQKIEPQQISTFDRVTRNALLHELKEKYSIRQLERVTGISRGIIAKA